MTPWTVASVEFSRQTGKLSVRKFLKKLKIELLYDPEILLLAISVKETKALTQKDIFTIMYREDYLQQPRHGHDLPVPQ